MPPRTCRRQAKSECGGTTSGNIDLLVAETKANRSLAGGQALVEQIELGHTSLLDAARRCCAGWIKHWIRISWSYRHLDPSPQVFLLNRPNIQAMILATPAKVLLALYVTKQG